MYEPLRIGAPLDKAIDIGASWPRCSLTASANGRARLADARHAGSRKLVTGARFYYPPTLLSNVHTTSIVAQQEIFGPVLAAMTFRTPAEAVELANNMFTAWQPAFGAKR